MIAYKLCSMRQKADNAWENEYCSFNNTRGEFSVSYNIGEWTYPKLAGSLLFVFDTLENARHYAREFHYSTLFECEVGEVFRPQTPTQATWDLREYWEKHINSMPIFIEGSYGTDRVKLLKEVMK